MKDLPLQMYKILIICFLNFSSVYSGDEKIGKLSYQTNCDSSKLILIRNNFWGTYNYDNMKLPFRKVDDIYLKHGYDDLYLKHRKLDIAKWSCYLGALTVMMTSAFIFDNHPPIDLSIGCTGVVCFSILNSNQRKLRSIFNTRICESND